MYLHFAEMNVDAIADFEVSDVKFIDSSQIPL